MRFINKNGFIKIAVVATCIFSVGAVHAEGTCAADIDPYENINRKFFKFNKSLDNRLLKPTAKAYVKYTPNSVERGVSNFFSNLGEITTIVNDYGQLKFQQGTEDFGRFLINTTLGVVGVRDVASRIGLEKHDEDFGQTAGFWGLKSGPYAMLPFMGPSSLRDAGGSVLNGLTNPATHAPGGVAVALMVGDAVDTRASLLQAEELIMGDEYLFIRDAYLQNREFEVLDGDIDGDEEDDFGDDMEEGSDC